MSVSGQNRSSCIGMWKSTSCFGTQLPWRRIAWIFTIPRFDIRWNIIHIIIKTLPTYSSDRWMSWGLTVRRVTQFFGSLQWCLSWVTLFLYLLPTLMEPRVARCLMFMVSTKQFNKDIIVISSHLQRFKRQHSFSI